MADGKNDTFISEVAKRQDQFDQISSSYITITNDIGNAMKSSTQAIDECKADIESLDHMTRMFIENATEQFENATEQFGDIRKRQDTYDGDMSSLHTWTENTQTSLDNVIAQLSCISEKFDFYADDYMNVYRYQIGDHIITFKKKINWFRRFLIRLIFGSCEIR